jgi:hypothetical protein
MIDWRQVPWTLWLFVAASLWSAMLLEIVVHGSVAVKVLFPVLVLAWLFLLLRGERWAWVVTIGVSLLGFLAELVAGSPHWQGIAGDLAGLALLVLPVTRSYFSRNERKASA